MHLCMHVLLAMLAVAAVEAGYWDITPTHGFLPPVKSAAFISGLSEPLRPLMERDFSLTAAGRQQFVQMVHDLPNINGMELQMQIHRQVYTETQLEDAFHAFSMVFANFARISGIINASAEVLVIPAPLSIPLTLVAQALDRVPAVAYPSLVLDNCQRMPNGEWKSQRLLSNLEEENQFYISHCQQEEALAPAIFAAAQLTACIESVHGIEHCGSEFIAQNLFKIADSVRNGLVSMKRIYRNISPASFFKDVRPYMKYLPHGKTVEFEGANIADGSSVFIPSDHIAGPTGAQTSSIPFLDALLGVTISDPVLNRLMIQFRQYQPQPHRRLLQRAELISPLLRAFVKSSVPRVQHAFDDALTAISEWRASHVILTNEYIQKQIPGEALGTGKTKFHRYLCQHLLETMNARVNPLSSTSVAIPDLCTPIVRDLQARHKPKVVESVWNLIVPLMNRLVVLLDIDLLQQ